MQRRLFRYEPEIDPMTSDTFMQMIANNDHMFDILDVFIGEEVASKIIIEVVHDESDE
jgi:hypothetical protein